MGIGTTYIRCRNEECELCGESQELTGLNKCKECGETLQRRSASAYKCTDGRAAMITQGNWQEPTDYVK